MYKLIVCIIVCMICTASNAQGRDAGIYYGIKFDRNEEQMASNLHAKITGGDKIENSITDGDKIDNSIEGSIDQQFSEKNLKPKGSYQTRHYFEATMPLGYLNLYNIESPVHLSVYKNEVIYKFPAGVGKYLDPLTVDIKENGISLSLDWRFSLPQVENVYVGISPVITYSQSQIRASSLLIDSSISENKLKPVIQIYAKIQNPFYLFTSFEIRAEVKKKSLQSIAMLVKVDIPLN